MLRVVSAPTGSICTLDELKARLRIDHDEDDDDLALLLDAATEMFEEQAGRVILRPTGFELSLSSFPACLHLPAFPVRGVTAITYTNDAGAEVEVDADDYSVADTADGARVVFVDGWSAPTLHEDTPLPVKVEFDAGYDDPAATDGSLPLKSKVILAVMMLVAHWYAIREAAGPDAMQTVPLGFLAIAAQERIYR